MSLRPVFTDRGSYVKFHLIMMNIKDVKPVSKTCIFFIQYVTLVTSSNNELFLP